jgi:uncharacterized protein with HEPN domain
MMRDPILANHILRFIDSVERYTAGMTKEDFLSNFMVQDAVTRNVELIGEACSKMSKETKDKASAIPWRDIIAMRNILIHEYYRSDPETIWNVVQHNLPNLKIHILKILNSLE